MGRKMSAIDVLELAGKTIGERGKSYDRISGERSGGRVAAAFQAITGKQFTAAEVYLVMQLAKDVRQWQRPMYHEDSAIDCVAYAALKAEALKCRE
jgi:hypothetical protein